MKATVAYSEPTGAEERKPRFVTGACNVEIEVAKMSITEQWAVVDRLLADLRIRLLDELRKHR